MKRLRAVIVAVFVAVFAVGGCAVLVRAESSTNEQAAQRAVQYMLAHNPQGVAQTSWYALGVSSALTHDSTPELREEVALIREQLSLPSQSASLALTTQSLHVLALSSTVPHVPLSIAGASAGEREQIDVFVKEHADVYDAMEVLGNRIAQQAGSGTQLSDPVYINDDIFVIVGLSGAASAYTAAQRPVPTQWMEVIRAGSDGLLAAQNDDGGWGYLAGGVSDADMTAAAVQALYAARASGALSAKSLSILAVRLGRAEHLMTTFIEEETGGVQLSHGLGANTISTAWVVQASLAQHHASQGDLSRRMQTYLRGMQTKEGWFRWTAEHASDASALQTTAQVIPALLGVSWPVQPTATQLFGLYQPAYVEPPQQHVGSSQQTGASTQSTPDPVSPSETAPTHTSTNTHTSTEEPVPQESPVGERASIDASAGHASHTGIHGQQQSTTNSSSPVSEGARVVASSGREHASFAVSEGSQRRMASPAPDTVAMNDAVPVLPKDAWRHVLVQADGTVRTYDLQWGVHASYASGMEGVSWHVFGGDQQGFGPLVALADASRVRVMRTDGAILLEFTPFPGWTGGFEIRSSPSSDGFYGVRVVPRSHAAIYSVFIGPDGVSYDYVPTKASFARHADDQLRLNGIHVCDGWDRSDLSVHRVDGYVHAMVASDTDNKVCMVHEQTGVWSWAYPFAGVDGADSVQSVSVAPAAVFGGMRGWMLVSTSSLHDPMFVSTMGRVARWQ